MSYSINFSFSCLLVQLLDQDGVQIVKTILAEVVSLHFKLKSF